MHARLRRMMVPLAFCVGCSATAFAQNSDVDTDYLYGNAFVGGGIGTDGTSRPATAQAGGSAGMGVISKKVGGLGFQQFVELGTMGPLATRPTPTWFVGYDLGTNLLISHITRDVPFALAGYSYVFGAGNAINFGVGIDHYYKAERAIRLEVRDYYTFTGAIQHNIAIRIGWQFGVHDD